MTLEVSHGSTSRRPVYSGTRRVPALHQRSRVDGSISFEARLRIDGRDRWITLDASTKSDAIRELDGLRVDRDRGEQRHRSLTPTLAELAEDWLAHLQSRVDLSDKRRRYSQGTVDLYRQRLDVHVLDQLGTRRVDDVTVDDLRRLVDRLGRKGLAPSTVTSCINIVSGLMRYALKRKLVPHNVVRDLDRDDRPGSKRQSEPRYLSAADVGLLLSKMSDTFRPVAATCAYAGLRVSEALGLRWSDVDFKAETITVCGQLDRAGRERLSTTKTGSSAATLPLLPVLRRELLAHRARQAERGLRLVHREQLIFQTLRGKPQSRRNLLRAVTHAAREAGLQTDQQEPVSTHDLRHSLVASAFEHGLTPPQVADLARHANAKVTLSMYAGLTDEGREQAIAKLVDGGFGK